VKIAILHPWFLEYGGAEKFVDTIIQIYPNADIFTLIADKNCMSDIVKSRPIYTSVLNKIQVFKKMGIRVRPMLFSDFFQNCIELMNIQEYELVISSCNTAFMGAIPGQNSCQVCYCHSPSRVWWDMYDGYKCQLPPILRYAFAKSSRRSRMWEYQAAQRIDSFSTNSKYVQKRIWQYYRRTSKVLYGPVDTSKSYISDRHDDYYLSIGRLVESKHIDILIEACNLLGKRLMVVGTGKEEKHLRKIAGPTIEFRGYVFDQDLPDVYANCRALLFAADEDLGLVPIEAQAYGRPVIAYGHGGALETIIYDVNNASKSSGVFFNNQTTKEVIKALIYFESIEKKFVPEIIRKNVLRFDTTIFKHRFKQFVDKAIEESERRQ
jgi:glycosyltransferase involved in cell wall biosynthesis